MASQCINVHVQVPANITLQAIQIGGADCLAGCTLTCGGGCVVPLTINIVATFANAGTEGSITPTLQVGSNPVIYPNEGNTITVPGSGTANATFTATGLISGDNTVCINY